MTEVHQRKGHSMDTHSQHENKAMSGMHYRNLAVMVVLSYGAMYATGVPS